MRYIISPRLTSAALLLTGTALSAGLTSAALAEVPRVVTDVPPVHALVSLVMGDLGQPELLLERGASEHHFQLRPSQAVAISEADLVVMIGPELTPWIEQPLTLRPAGSAVLGLLAAEGTHLQNYAEAGDDHEGHDHAHDHGHEHGEEGHDHADHDHGDHDHSHEGHDHGEEAHSHDDHGHEGHDHDSHDHDDHGHSHSGTDPHAWLDPANGQLWLGVIAAELGKIDPENATTYTANAEAAKAQIAEADQQAKALLDPVKTRAFVGFHDAFGYYTGHYGLTSAGSVSPGDASTPGAKHLTELKAKVAAGEVICLFPEAGQDPALATRVAENTGVKIGAPLDPVGTLMEPGPGLYAALITGTAETLASCLTP